jgi:monoterpene epsilon-lactone hydrolase
MSRIKPLLNAWLHWIEKPYLARVKEPQTLRRSFERKARFIFTAPSGTTRREDVVSGVPVLHVAGADTPASSEGPLVLYVHGGAYTFGSARTHLGLAGAISVRVGWPVCLVDYRLAPEHPFPAAIDDLRAVYAALADRVGGVILGGDSAGGGLVLALLGDLLARRETLPRAVFAFSPVTDLAFSTGSFQSNRAADVLLPAERAKEMTDLYLGDADPTDPLASPIHADFNGAPPVWLSVGTTEILLDDTRRMTDKLRAQGVVVEEVIEDDLPHVWPFFQRFLPEGRATLDALADWLKRQVRA